MLEKRSVKWTYACLWIIRIYFALWGTGYIHPDEHMQNGEVSAGDVLGYHTLKTWEWTPSFPLRSIVPPFVTTGIPFSLSNLLYGEHLQPDVIFRTGRILFLGLSMLLDYSLTNLIPDPNDRRLGLLLLASSHAMHTFQVRPFSNSIEAVLVAICLVLLRQVVSIIPDSASKRPTRALHLLAILFATGTFVRPTFPIFGLPVAYQVILWSIRAASRTPERGKTFQYSSWLRLVAPPLVTSILTSLSFIGVDSMYFRGDFKDVVATPLNFFLYNLSQDNLSEHGLHPRWLHLFVNLPMIVGPWVLLLALRTAWQYTTTFDARTGRKIDSATQIINKTIVHMTVLSMSALSIQPHQEPRFLTPLLLPIIILVSNSGQIVRAGRTFWWTWAVSNIALAIVFGVLHQGGVVPSLLHLRGRLASATSSQGIHFIYWKTYMPPRHLLGIRQQDYLSGLFRITDLAGAPRNDLVKVVLSDTQRAIYMVTPIAMHSTLPEAVSRCMTLEHRMFPHLDLDHIPESVQAGWLDGLSLGVYELRSACLNDVQRL
ncbi:glycosyltransferase family 22 protein [Leucogyrophana mollusca]|uniref:Glycosyltransferase family 22 protein n=1 Tax=Leucogyrophana mollusca TaxID=85980 RepID=A0ACB8BSU7_9AGAM|nr:glycosyltransferase family 22 protein [Leucogyrophana mollusca]